MWTILKYQTQFPVGVMYTIRHYYFISAERPSNYERGALVSDIIKTMISVNSLIPIRLLRYTARYVSESTP